MEYVWWYLAIGLVVTLFSMPRASARIRKYVRGGTVLVYGLNKEHAKKRARKIITRLDAYVDAHQAADSSKRVGLFVGACIFMILAWPSSIYDILLNTRSVAIRNGVLLRD